MPWARIFVLDGRPDNSYPSKTGIIAQAQQRQRGEEGKLSKESGETYPGGANVDAEVMAKGRVRKARRCPQRMAKWEESSSLLCKRCRFMSIPCRRVPWSFSLFVRTIPHSSHAR